MVGGELELMVARAGDVVDGLDVPLIVPVEDCEVGFVA
jgi:hypothetical protein